LETPFDPAAPKKKRVEGMKGIAGGEAVQSVVFALVAFVHHCLVPVWNLAV
jgi:hypothetical protein